MTVRRHRFQDKDAHVLQSATICADANDQSDMHPRLSRRFDNVLLSPFKVENFALVPSRSDHSFIHIEDQIGPVRRRVDLLSNSVKPSLDCFACCATSYFLCRDVGPAYLNFWYLFSQLSDARKAWLRFVGPYSGRSNFFHLIFLLYPRKVNRSWWDAPLIALVSM